MEIPYRQERVFIKKTISRSPYSVYAMYETNKKSFILLAILIFYKISVSIIESFGKF